MSVIDCIWEMSRGFCHATVPATRMMHLHICSARERKHHPPSIRPDHQTKTQSHHLLPELKPSHPDFEIIGFPCNQFGGQDPGSNDEIQSFCQLNYGVTFPVLGKIDVNGDKADPLYDWLKKSKPGILGLQRIKWNFEKFLIGKDGEVKDRWASTSSPASLKAAIEKELAVEGKL